MHRSARRTSRITTAVLGTLLTLPLAACGALGQGEGPGGDVASIESAPAEAFDGSTDVLSSASKSQDSNRSIIRNGDMTVEVKDPAVAVDQATNIAENLGGYVESQSMSNSVSGAPDGANVTIRVPSAKLDEAFAALGELGSVRHEQRSAQDVTAQHVDLQARVASLQTSVDRLTELMAGSASTSELIEAESALAARQAELDSLSAQLKMLEGQVNESTIYVSFTTSSALPGGPSNFWEGLLAGLNSLSLAASGALVLLGVLLPWLLIAAVITFAIIWLVRRKRPHHVRAAAPQPPAPHATAPYATAPHPGQPPAPEHPGPPAAEETRA